MDEVGSDNLFLQYDFYHHAAHGRRSGARPSAAQGSHRARPDRRQSRPQRARHRRDQLSLPVRASRPRGLRRLDRLRVQAHRPATSAGLGWFEPYLAPHRTSDGPTEERHESRIYRARHHGRARWRAICSKGGHALFVHDIAAACRRSSRRAAGRSAQSGKEVAAEGRRHHHHGARHAARRGGAVRRGRRRRRACRRARSSST